MAKKKADKDGRPDVARTDGEARFPYTTKPSSLRKLLQQIPKKPKPPKFNKNLLKAWGFTDTNDYSMIRVLKVAGLLNVNNEPTDVYTRYMNLQNGASALAEPIRKIYQPLFNASHAPDKEPAEALKNMFNIHSAASEDVIEKQIQTFKALCENTSFDSLGPQPATSAMSPVTRNDSTGGSSGSVHDAAPNVHINVHIHLPENKSQRDYEAMIEDIGRHIFGRTSSVHSNE